MKPTQQPLPDDANAPEKLLTTDEVAQWLGIRRCTLEKARSTRLGDFPPYVRIGKAVRYQQKAVQAWLTSRTFNTDGSPSLPLTSNHR